MKLITTYGVTATDGTVVPVDSLDQAITYNGDGTINYVQVVYNGNTYRQTLSYSGGNVSSVSMWVKQ